MYKQENFRFVFLADTHIGRYKPGTEALRDLLVEIDSLDPAPDFVLVGGDLVETGMDYEYEELMALLTKFKRKIYFAMGNHESRWTEDLKQSYERYLGLPYYSFDHKGVHFVVLDTSIYGQAYGHIETTQLEWLEKELEALSPEKPLVLISHHPLGYPADFTDNWEHVFLLCQGKNFILHLAGHGHQAVNWNFINVPMFMAPAGMKREYLILDVLDKDINIYKKEFGNKPELWTSISLRTKPLEAFNIPKELKNYIWRYKTGGAIIGAPALSKDKVLVNSVDGTLYCLDKKTGAMLWQNDDNGMCVAEPLITKIREQEVVVFTSGTGAIKALDLEDGKCVWEYQTKRALSSSPNVYNGNIYFGQACAFTALNLDNGKINWQIDINGLANVKPAVDDEGVYFGAWDGYFHGYRHNGEKIFKTLINESIYFSSSTGNPQVAKGVIVCTSAPREGRGGILALDKATGDVLWSKSLMVGYCTPKVVLDTVYVVDLGGRVVGFNLKTGEETFELELKRETFNNQPLYIDGHLYVNNLRRSIAAVDLAEHTFKFININNSYLLSHLKSDGENIYVGSFDDYLYALKL